MRGLTENGGDSLGGATIFSALFDGLLFDVSDGIDDELALLVVCSRGEERHWAQMHGLDGGMGRVVTMVSVAILSGAIEPSPVEVRFSLKQSVCGGNSRPLERGVDEALLASV